MTRQVLRNNVGVSVIENSYDFILIFSAQILVFIRTSRLTGWFFYKKNPKTVKFGTLASLRIFTARDSAIGIASAGSEPQKPQFFASC